MAEPLSPETEVNYELEASTNPLDAIDNALLAIRDSIPEQRGPLFSTPEGWDRVVIPNASAMIRREFSVQQEQVIAAEQARRRDAGLEDSFDAVFNDLYVEHKAPTGGYPPMSEYIAPQTPYELFPVLSGKSTEALLRKVGIIEEGQTLDNLKQSPEWERTAHWGRHGTISGVLVNEEHRGVMKNIPTKIPGVSFRLSEYKDGMRRFISTGSYEPAYEIGIGFDRDTAKNILKTPVGPSRVEMQTQATPTSEK